MANEEMIQKHLDNFLAKIAGETPVDDTVQNSTEFWINKIAEQGGGGGSKVVANPTLEGGEDDLTSIEIDGTKYAIPAGAYIATLRTTADITVDSFNYIRDNYLTTPCYVPYRAYLFPITQVVNNTLYSVPLHVDISSTTYYLTQIRVGQNGAISETLKGISELAANATTFSGSPSLTSLKIDNNTYKVRDGATNGLGYLTTAPTSANNDGIKIVVLSSEPATKYDGYLYLITEA